MERMTVQNRDEFHAALNFTLQRGDHIVYHTGLLMFDRLMPASMRQHPGVEKLNQLADAIWRAYKAGKVTLVQRKISERGCEYIAVKL